MKIPGSFSKMTLAFHQDIGLLHPRIEEVYKSAVDMVPAEERVELRRFLEDLLAATPATREHVWGESRAEVGFRRDEGLVAALRALRDRL